AVMQRVDAYVANVPVHEAGPYLEREVFEGELANNKGSPFVDPRYWLERRDKGRALGDQTARRTDQRGSGGGALQGYPLVRQGTRHECSRSRTCFEVTLGE